MTQTRRSPRRLPRFVAFFLLLLGCGDATSALDTRIQNLMGRAPFGVLNWTEARRIFTTSPEEDRPFFMVNLIRHREHATYRDGRPTDLTGAEADALYGSLVLPILADIGAMPVFATSVDRGLIDADSARWDQVAVVRYPSRAAFVAMLERPDFREAAVHKVAGIERSIVLVTEVEEIPLPDGFRKVDLTKVPYPPGPGDPTVAVVNVLDYRDHAVYADGRETDLTGREAMGLYESARASQALPLGVRPGLWLTVEAELFGDGQAWEEVRINNFPSRTTLEKLITKEALDEVGYDNRDAGIERTYALTGTPQINAFGFSR